MRLHALPGAAAAAAILALALPARAGTLTVPSASYATPCAAIAAAQPGDEVDVSGGPYTDSCELNAQGLTLKGVGATPKIDLSGTNHPADDKGIYVVQADGVTIENLELTGAHIDDSEGGNAAGLRITGHDVVVRGCFIHDNQNGILAAPIVDGGTLTIEYTELDHNGLGDACDQGGCVHNVYVSKTSSTVRYDRTIFQFNWSHDLASDTADKGHLLKSRSRETDVLYNRITGEGGHDSYEVDLPNGGLGIVVGNVIEKGTSPDNSILLDYGEEGIDLPTTDLYVAFNTFVNDYTGGTFINVAAGATLTAHDNLFFGPGTLSSAGPLSADNVLTATPMFVSPSTYDYHLMTGSPAIGQAVAPGSAGSASLVPAFEYVQPLESVARLAAKDVGAFEYGTVTTGAGGDAGVVLGDGGAPGADAGSGGGASSGSGSGSSAGRGSGSGRSSGSGSGEATGGADAGRGATGPSSSGCSCRATGARVPGWGAGLGLGLVALAVAGRRRRARGGQGPRR